MPGFMPGIHGFLRGRRGRPGQARPWLCAQPLIRHARLYAGHPRLWGIATSKTWMAGTSPAMTLRVNPAMTPRVNPALTLRVAPAMTW